jgi:predicted phage terminase large subunit-like protein
MQMKIENNLETYYKRYESLSSERKKSLILLTEWLSKARPKQVINYNDGYNIYLFLAGRGFGKTLLSSYSALEHCFTVDNATVAMICPTFGDLRRVAFEGESGIVNILDKHMPNGFTYNKSEGEITLFNGSKIIGIPAIEPNRIRGLNLTQAHVDELCSFRYDRDVWDNLMMALRLGHNPKTIITTTPKNRPLLKEIIDRKDCKVVRGSTFENEANLSESAIAMYREKYEGTLIGKQELYGEIIDYAENALFKFSDIEQHRIRDIPDLNQVVVAIDPAVTANKNSDETGIIVCGRDNMNHYYILDDKSGIFSPDVYLKMAVQLYNKYEANYIVAEVNNGGDLIQSMIKRLSDNPVPYKAVRATRGKMVRAEPIAGLYEQGKVHHVGSFSKLEEQMCQYTADTISSPDRLDALVWGIWSLSQSSGKAVFRIS